MPDLHPSLPDGPPHWLGVRYEDSWSTLNRLTFVSIERAQAETGAVGRHRGEPAP